MLIMIVASHNNSNIGAVLVVKKDIINVDFLVLLKVFIASCNLSHLDS